MLKAHKRLWLVLLLVFCTSCLVFATYNRNDIKESKPTSTKKIPKKAEKKEEVLYLGDLTLPTYGEAYATISCARIGFEKTLYYGDSDAILDVAIGQFAGSGFPGQGKPILVAGHNGTHFKLIPNLQVGDIVEITTFYGSYQYQMTRSEIIEVSDFSQEILSDNREYLIMYTCYPFDQIVGVTQRYFIYADLVSGTKVVDHVGRNQTKIDVKKSDSLQ